MKTISIFNNKGGVGKTTYLFHVAHLLSEGATVLLVDCDSQCNLSAYCLDDDDIAKSWSDAGNSIYKCIEPVYETVGDFRKLAPIKLGRKNLHLVPGDLRLSDFEDRLGDSWNSAKGGSNPDLRAQAAIFRYVKWAGESIGADYIFCDLGPNLGALNRAVLAGSDFFITPIAPDLFSLQGTENLGRKLLTWRNEWKQCNDAKKDSQLETPHGCPVYAGYVIQQHNIRTNSEGMTRGWAIYGKEIEPKITENIVSNLKPHDQVVEWKDGTYNLGQIPNLHSLIPYSQEARKPVFDCTGQDGLNGAHITKARDSRIHFKPICDAIIAL